MLVKTLLEAAARVLDENTPRAFNTNRVAEVAGVSVGSLYQYFPDKASLLRALAVASQDKLERDIEEAIQNLQGRPFSQVVQRLVAIAISQQYDRPRLAAAIDQEQLDEGMAPSVGVAETRLGQALQKLLAQHAAELAPDLSPDAALDCLRIAKTLVEADVSRGSPSPDLGRRVERAVLGYLGVRFEPVSDAGERTR